MAKVQPEAIPTRTNDDLPAPQKLLTGRSQPGRFPANQPAANDRFTRPQNEDEQPSRPFNGNQQTAVEQTRPFSMTMTAFRHLTLPVDFSIQIEDLIMTNKEMEATIVEVSIMWMIIVNSSKDFNSRSYL